MWFRFLRLHGRRLPASIRERAHLFASARREPRAGCARAAGCRDPHLRSAHLQPAHHPASKGARRLARSPASQIALTEPSRSFAGEHAIPIMRPRVQQQYGRCNICHDIAVCLRQVPPRGRKPGRRGMGQVEFIFGAPRRIFRHPLRWWSRGGLRSGDRTPAALSPPAFSPPSPF